MEEKIRELFDLNNFNIYSDNDYYYFFRALNKRDIECINDGRIVDENGNITKIITDREFYGATSGYDENSKLSLEEITDHIKMHYNKHTNCISLTTNANVALLYGRDFYSDQYIIYKVSKDEMGKDDVFAGSYMLEEINKRIDELVSSKNLDNYDMQKYFFDAINNASTFERLQEIKEMFPEEYAFDDDRFVGGLEFTHSKNYNSLNQYQNLLKNKIIMKLDVLNKQLLPRISNTLLIQTIGNAFSSLEITHYKDILGDRIISVSSELMDILSLLQQLPSDVPYLQELKEYLVSNADRITINNSIDYDNKDINDVNLSLDNMFSILNGKVSYKDAYDLYSESFYLAKSKLRAKKTARILKDIVKNNPVYDDIINYVSNNTYGIEAEISTKMSVDLFNVSESVSLDARKELIAYIEDLDEQRLEDIINNPNETLKTLLKEYVDEDDIYPVNKDIWYANSIIDLFDWESLGVKEKLSYEQRQDIINALIEHNFMDAYGVLKLLGVKEKDIAYNLFYALIRNDNVVNYNKPLTLEEIEWFIGYNRIKETKLTLRNYQRNALENLNKIYQNKQFASAILPTGTGKSYLAIAKMLENSKAKMIYIAPNNIILDQIQSIIRDTLSITEEHLGDRKRDVVRRAFPNLTLGTYQILQGEIGSRLKQDNYDLIILDELHRSGASLWQQDIEELLKNQNNNTKILGITATPERDRDNKDMSELWAAKLYGYTDREVKLDKHLAINMDLEDAIRKEIVANPRIVNCLYSLKSSGKLAELEELMNLDKVNLPESTIQKYEKLRREVENADGIERVLHDNLNPNDKVIVFIPITKKSDDVYEDEDGNRVCKSDGERVIKDYMTLFRQYLYAYDYLKTNPIIYDIYKKISSEEELSLNEIHFLNNEKDNILLLNKIDITGKPSALNTEINNVAETIITFMNWDILTKIKLAKELTNKTKDKIDTYSLLSSYANSKNERELAAFNSDRSNNKIKAMFVMNKLNEGAHLKGVKKIAWFRALDSDSRILFYQQLGRCITSLTPGEELKEEDKPTVIDLVNNTILVRYNKKAIQEEKDLNSLLLIELWIKNNGRMPNICSSNKEEVSNAKTLIFINKRYSKYIDNPTLLDEIKVDVRDYIKEILKIGSDIDLWNIDVIYEEKFYQEKNNKELKENDDLFIISPVLRDFIALENKLDNSVSPQDWVKAIEEYCNEYKEWPKSLEKAKIINKKTGQQLFSWLRHSGFNSGLFKYIDEVDENGNLLIEVLDELKDTYQEREFTPQQWVKTIEEYCKLYQEWPFANAKSNIKNSKSGRQLSAWLRNSGFNSGLFKYTDEVDENGNLLIEVLDELHKKYPSKKSQLSPQEWVNNIEEYCKLYQEWPSITSRSKIINSKTGYLLHRWLMNSGYTSGNFKFINAGDENGRPLKDILDELKDIYQKQGFTPQQWVKMIEEYCKIYKKWPNQRSNRIVNDKTGQQLYHWLMNSGYVSDKFRYTSELDESGKPLKEVLDSLKNEYQPKQISPQEYVKDIEEYCKIYNEWPESKEYSKNIKGKTGQQLYSWLMNSGYVKSNFMYINEADDNGNPLIEVLDELHRKYPSKKVQLSPKEWVHNIEEYCKLYQEWPSITSRSKIINSKTGHRLYTWLVYSGYTSGNFKFINAGDENGRTLKDILDELYFKYNNRNKEKLESLKETKKKLQTIVSVLSDKEKTEDDLHIFKKV